VFGATCFPIHSPSEAALTCQGLGRSGRENGQRLAYIQMEDDTVYLFNIAMENGPFIDGLPIKNGDFPWLC